MDVFLSHDWPQGIEHHGALGKLLGKKPAFKEDVPAILSLIVDSC